MKPKPIETKYQGCLFRSRLEARWAVFFDKLGIPWEYEKEGYDLEEGGLYLPDFWLPQQDCFFEVKGAEPSTEERLKAFYLSKTLRKVVAVASGTMGLKSFIGMSSDTYWLPVSGYRVYLFGGEAWAAWDTAPHNFGVWESIMTVYLPPFIATLDPDRGEPDGMTEDGRRRMIDVDRRYYFSKYGKEHPQYIWGRCVEGSWKYNKMEGCHFVEGGAEGGGEVIMRAMEAARSARF
jgi:hypothetical protein